MVLKKDELESNHSCISCFRVSSHLVRVKGQMNSCGVFISSRLMCESQIYLMLPHAVSSIKINAKAVINVLKCT